MDGVAQPGRVVILNGSSSAGKSSIVQRFCESRAHAGDLWISVGIDDFNQKLPLGWFDLPGRPGPFSAEGVHFERVPEGLIVRAGTTARRMYQVYRRVVALWARAGFNVLVDEVAFEPEAVHAWGIAMSQVDVTWVGLRCDPDVAEERERQRSDRMIGLARGLSTVVHGQIRYDLELDATTSTAEELAGRLAAFVLDDTK
jgi:chloramphenicol 3-O phosphotransferase